MNVGMLWLDAEKERGFGERLARAADYYREKYGRRANLVFVHPETVGEASEGVVTGLTVRIRPDILRDHFWIGVEEPAGGPASGPALRPDSRARR